MTDTDLTIRLEPLGSEKCSIVFITETGTIKRTLGGVNGYTEADLRSATGLSACGLTEDQIKLSIATANKKRNV